MKYLGILALLMAAIAATVEAGFAQYLRAPGWSVLEAEQLAGRQVFHDHCAACHAQKSGARVHAPNLAGVVGRPAGIVAGFPYSDAMKKSGLVWTEDNLRKWIVDSANTVPGTLMPHVSISDPAEQIYVITYLKSLKKRAAH